jgi:hypothetical protein
VDDPVDAASNTKDAPRARLAGDELQQDVSRDRLLGCDEALPCGRRLNEVVPVARVAWRRRRATNSMPALGLYEVVGRLARCARRIARRSSRLSVGWPEPPTRNDQRCNRRHLQN